MSNLDYVLEAIQSLREDDFTKKVFIPLFKSLGYFDVQFHGGTYEKGKDFIAVKKDLLGRMEVSVGQVKKLESTRNIDTRKQFDDIIYQLRQCFSRKVEYKDGISHLPRDVFFVTPFVIETRLLEEQFAALVDQPHRIIIIDGAILLQLLKDNCPEIIDAILGLDEKITELKESDLLNNELLAALNTDSEVDCDKYYSDLRFFAGTIDSNYLINNSIHFDGSELSVPTLLWKKTRERILEIERIIGFSPTTVSAIEVDESYNNQKIRYLSSENNDGTNKLSENIRLYKEGAKVVIDIIDAILNNNKRHIVESVSKQNSDINEDSFRGVLEDLRSSIVNISLQDYEITTHNILVGLKEYGNLLGSKNTEIDEIIDRCEGLNEYLLNIDRLKKIVVYEPEYKVSLDSERLKTWSFREVSWYRDCVKSENINRLSRSQLKEFLVRMEILLNVMSKLFNKEFYISRYVSSEKNDSPETPVDEDRFDVSAHTIFDSGEDIAIFGEAGAGKTTTLQMYIKGFKNKSEAEKTIIYFPLNRISSIYVKHKGRFEKPMESDPQKLVKMDPVDTLFGCFLLYKNISMGRENIIEIKRLLSCKSSVVFVFDGVDEAISESPWILKAIDNLKGEVDNSQLIISSRDCVNYLDRVNFLGITLLPFRKEQLKRFIYGWLDHDVAENVFNQICDKELLDVAKTPLLATIICSLAKGGVDIPDNEPDVYRQYFNLMLGFYDNYKDIRRVESQYIVLEYACRKLGFHMHEKGIREVSMDDIEGLFDRGYGSYSSDVLKVAAAELINPCNLLKKVPGTEKYSFGHLRFQEFLAAEELTRNRGIDIVSLTTGDWWRGALYLYAFNSDIDQLLEDVYSKYGGVSRSYITLRKMISASPASKQFGLLEMLDKAHDVESLESTSGHYDGDDFYVDIGHDGWLDNNIY